MNPKFASPFGVYHGGGSQFELPDGAVITVTDVAVTTETMNDQTMVGIRITGTDETGEERSEFLFAGRSDSLRVAGNNIETLKEVGDQFMISASSPMGIFVESLNALGYPWDGDTWDKEGWTQLVGAKLTISRVPVLDKNGKPKVRVSSKTGAEYPLTNCTVSAFVAPQRRKGAPVPQNRPATVQTPAGADDAVAETLEGLIAASLPISKVEAIKKINAEWFTNKDEKTAAVKLLNAPWASASERPWKLQGGQFVAA